MDNDSHLFYSWGYTVAAACAGAITALSLTSWRTMSKMEVGFTLAVGFFFAMFITPYVATHWLGVPETDTKAIAALTYISGSGYNFLLPLVLRRVSRSIDTSDKEETANVS